jgi:carbon-monoxide dehydrogenase medium subunit
MATAVGEQEILTAIEIPARAAGQGSAYAKFEHPASRYAVVGAAAVVTVSNGTCTAAAVAICGLVPRPQRAPSVEKALTGKQPTPEAIAAAAAGVGADLGADIIGDVYASAAYRKAVAPVYVKRALTAACARAR